MDVKDYLNEAHRQLSDERFYKKLHTNPTDLHAELVNNAIDNLKNRNLIPVKVAQGLKIKNPRTPLFYILPKIHKVNNPGRPVVSSVSCHTESISRFVDHYLQSLVKLLPSYIQDTTDFLLKLNNLPDKLPNDAFLVTLDVKSLYTNIPNDEGIEAVKFYLRSSEHRDLSQAIAAFLTLILSLNNFQFNDENYIQLNGVSMGTKCAPTYANLFMGYFEDRNILPLINELSLIYSRFIDDIFFIWTGTEGELLNTVKTLNSIHPTIKFELTYSKERINFLDVLLEVTEDKRLKTSVYIKPTDKKNYLHAKSYHPKSTIDALPYGQALRFKRICSDDNDFTDKCKILAKDLENRGHNKSVIEKGINKAKEMKREELLKYKENRRTQRIPLIITFDKRLPNLKEKIDNTWNTLHINNEEAPKFLEKPLICFKRNKNLKDLIGQTRITKGKVARKKLLKIGKCSPCLSRADNKCCKHLVSTSSFSNRSGTRKYKIYHNINCKSKNVIYLVECRICTNKPYVGKCEEQGINKRINSHRNDAKKKKLTQ